MMLHAARLAGVDDFVSQHPTGYDWRVGERGALLSDVASGGAIAPTRPAPR
ncbi:MAG: hypothetical protein FD153_649 [Rhodospirillaceae bacterium]|nr:MAG: hypothetical protein FD153_649 [Rhodospirillaceae bacterium]